MKSGTEIYRPHLGRKIPLFLALLVLILSVFGASAQSGGPAFSYVWLVTMPIVSSIVIMALLLVARPRLEIGAVDLVVVNILSRRRVGWAQIVAVRFAKDAPWASLDLVDGTNLKMMAVQNSDGARARGIALEIANRCIR
ncbi:MAG TPA: PH domain-containing protein [Candidatus Nanopelagicaceae bacterium]|nr:PH domain-containing protein [Candidatus Nanopelagicaceae bacterium]